MKTLYIADLIRPRAKPAPRFRRVEQAPDSALFKVVGWQQYAAKTLGRKRVA